MKSILHKVTRADVVPRPFPHVVVDGALEEDLYAQLSSTFPPPEAIVDGRRVQNNAPYRMPAARLLSDPRVADGWKEFARYHTSAAFFREVLSIFGDSIQELHPTLLSLDEARTSIRGAEPFADVALDCQPCWGAPVTRASSSDPCHVDRPVTLFAGLLYCRLPGDDTAGGDLELYRFRGWERRYDATRHVDASLVEPVRRIPYAANRLVFFLQSPHSLHGVTVRAVTPWPRLHVNFLAEMQRNVFELESSLTAEVA
jgi:hypothetical protein